MKRTLLALFLCAFVFTLSVDARRTARIKNLQNCPEEGNGGDPNLNKRKNIRSDNRRATLGSIQWMKDRPDPRNFVKGGSRSELTRLGEGQKITVVAYALVARPEGAETCNCGLTAPKAAELAQELLSTVPGVG